MTFETIIDEAKSRNWTNRQIKDALFGIGAKSRLDEVLAAIGREKGPAAKPPLLVAEAPGPQPAIPAEIPEPPPEVKLADGAVIWCDAAENKVRRKINGYGKLATFDNGGHRIGLRSGELVERHYNTVCPDQFAGECFAVLKAVELAVRHRLKSCTIRNDRIGGFAASVKRGYKGAAYLWVAKKIAADNGLAVAFDLCGGEENLADRISRTEA